MQRLTGRIRSVVITGRGEPESSLSGERLDREAESRRLSGTRVIHDEAGRDRNFTIKTQDWTWIDRQSLAKALHLVAVVVAEANYIILPRLGDGQGDVIKVVGVQAAAIDFGLKDFPVHLHHRKQPGLGMDAEMIAVIIPKNNMDRFIRESFGKQINDKG